MAAAHEQWTSRNGFVLAAIGGAVGLGNIWRFPYLTGENGGGVFVIVYLVAVVLVAIPILIAELQLGKRGHKDIVSGTRNVAVAAGRSKYWGIIGWLGMLAAFFVLTYYSVIAGQVIDYFFQTGTGTLVGVNPEEAQAQLETLESNPWRMMIGHTVIMIITIAVVARGIQGGVEKAAKFMMPTFFVMLMGMFFYALVVGDFAQGFTYMFDFKFDQVRPGVVLEAIGQAFFSIGIGFGYMLAFGSFLTEDISIPKTSVVISLADAGVALIAGLVIFPLVYAFFPNAECLDAANAGLAACQEIKFTGPGLIFNVLPVAFGQMPGGAFFGALFFLLLTFAALSSAIAILQPAVSYLEGSWGFSVKGAAVTAGSLAWFLGIGSVLSFNLWKKDYPLSFLETFAEKNVMASVDFITANYMMLVGGILIAVFVGWTFKSEWVRGEFKGLHPVLFTIWLWLARVFAPAAVAVALYIQLTS